MTNNTISIEPILKSIECYSTTSLQLFKLYVVDFIGTLFAELYTKLIVLVLLVSCFIFLSIGIALWLGTIIGAAYLGFLALAAIFLILTILIITFKKYLISNPSYNHIVKELKSKQ
jgi:hypothetical protein